MRVIVVAIAACLLGTAPCLGQDQYNYFPQCPEGCRAIDRLVSCGSSTAVWNCSMADNGDVALQCGTINAPGCTLFTLDRHGCRSVSCSDGHGSVPHSSNIFLERIIELGLKLRADYNSIPHGLVQAVSGGEIAVGVILALFGTRLGRITRLACGFGIGAFIGYAVMQLTSVHTPWSTVTVALVAGGALSVLGFLSERVIMPFFGMATGLVITLMVMFLLDESVTTRNAIITAAVTLVVGESAVHIPDFIFLVFCSLFGGVLMTTGFTQLYYNQTLLAAANSNNHITVFVVLVCCWVIGFLVQLRITGPGAQKAAAERREREYLRRSPSNSSLRPINHYGAYE